MNKKICSGKWMALWAPLCILPHLCRAGSEDAPPALISEILYMTRDLPGVNKPAWLSPTALAVSPDGGVLYVAEHTARRIDFVNPSNGAIIKSVPLPREPNGMALTKDGSRMYVMCCSEAFPRGIGCIINTSSGAVEKTFSAGYFPISPVLSPDETVLYVCSRFTNSVLFFDAQTGAVTAEVPLIKEPYAMGVTPDGNELIVANNLAYGPSTLTTVTCGVSVISTQSKAVVSTIYLSNGSHTTTSLCITPDGKYAFIPHVLGRFHIITNEIRNGWIYSNEIAIIDIPGRKLLNTISIDDNVRGSGNPWGSAISADGKRLGIAVSGTNEACVIDLPGLVQKIALRDSTADQDFTFLQGIKKRIALKGDGARPVAFGGNDKFFVGSYFSDTVNVVDLSQEIIVPVPLALGNTSNVPGHRKGEMEFFSAKRCLQNWQSCHSCHPEVRSNALNWDLKNDGTGNPKDVKSLLLAQVTPPSMSHGVRADYHIGVRAGFTHILFTEPFEEAAAAIDTFIAWLRPVPSPHLVEGRMTEAAGRGRELYNGKFGCNHCHPAPFYADLLSHDVGTRNTWDQGNEFDTPTLIECWRTGPYLHDGRYSTLREIFTDGYHGIYIAATDQEIEDLIAFISSL
jgi:YVTN family beta-propeller protein